MYKYNNKKYNNISDLIDAVSAEIKGNSHLDNMFGDNVDSDYDGGIRLGACVYPGSYVWQRIDPIGYYSAFQQYIDSYIYDLGDMKPEAVLLILSGLGINVEEVETKRNSDKRVN